MLPPPVILIHASNVYVESFGCNILGRYCPLKYRSKRMTFASIFNNERFVLDVPSSGFIFHVISKSFNFSSFTVVEVVVVAFIGKQKQLLLDCIFRNG